MIKNLSIGKCNFNLISTSLLIDGGVDTLASIYDINRIVRPQVGAGDICDFEYVLPNSMLEITDFKFEIYPNPVTSHFEINHTSKSAEIVRFFFKINGLSGFLAEYS